MKAEYKNWIMAHKISDVAIKDNGDNIELATDYAIGRINFYDMNVIIVEMSVTNLADDEDKFYLHFELEDLNYAKSLFNEMVETLTNLKDQQVLKVLLSCTSGLTTGFFADKLNEAAKILSLKYEFNAVPFNELYTEGFDYSVILLAPQIAYQFKNVNEVFHDKLILKIPPKIFASYDTAEMLKFIRAELDKSINTTVETAIAEVREGIIKSDAKILSIAVMTNNKQTRIAYRIYEKGVPIFNETVIKGKLNVIRDLEDILSTVSRRCKFDAVGIAIPGIVRGGYLDFEEYIFPDENLNQLLREAYGFPVTITNISNAAVLGYYAQQNKYENILLVSHPRGFTTGGAGVVVNGKMIQGSHSIAGEVKYVVRGTFNSNDFEDNIDVEKFSEFISLEIRSGISTIDPEIVCVNGGITPDVNIIKNKIMEVIPEEYLPEFVYISDTEMAEYILLGQMILALEKSAKH